MDLVSRDAETEAEEPTSRFADSCDAYTAHDLQNMERGRRRTNLLSLVLRCVIIAVCIAMLGYSVYEIAEKLIDDQLAAAAYAALRADPTDTVTLARSKHLQEPSGMPTVLQMLNADGKYEDYIPTPDGDVDPDRASHYAQIYANFLKRAGQYPNMYAWICMTDTVVDYPVMFKEHDNEYYLAHDFRGQESHSGSIFADGWVSPNYYGNLNMVLYGHNMKNGSMFHSVKTWCNSAKIKTLVNTTQIEIYTREGLYIYEILSYYIDDTFFYDETEFESDEEYLAFLDKIAGKSYVKTDRSYNADSRICTLITCTNGSDGDSRYVVHGLLKQFVSSDSLR